MKTKIELIKKAYEWLRISGLTVDPTPEDAVLALDELEIYMNELETRNICTQYNFEETPNPSSDSGVDVAYYGAVEKGLAMRLAQAFGKGFELPTTFINQASAALSNWAATTSVNKQVAPPRTQPRGSGVTFRFPRWIRYFRVDNGAPISCDTLELKTDGIEFFAIDFNDYLLGNNTITSYTITGVTGGIQVLQDQLIGNQVQIQVKGLYTGTAQITITVDTSSGRINPQKVFFNVTE